MNLTQEDIDQAKGFNDLVETARDFGLSLEEGGEELSGYLSFSFWL